MKRRLRLSLLKTAGKSAAFIAGSMATLFVEEGATGKVALASPPPQRIAQLIPDDTLGAEGSTVSSEGSFENGTFLTIEGGAMRGPNLFHSFELFNVDETEQVYFDNPTNITTILNRVTGTAPSSIFGTLGVGGNADLFLLNPNGIVFGPNAELDIAGSFVASSAENLIFDSGGFVFGTGSPEAPSLLEINVPTGLQYGADPGALVVQGSGNAFSPEAFDAGLKVQANQTLALLGGNVEVVNGGKLTTGVFEGEGSRIELGSIGENGQVALMPISSGWEFDYSNVENFRDVLVGQTSLIEAFDAQSIQIKGQQVVLEDGSLVSTAHSSMQSGGDLTISAETLSIENGAAAVSTNFGEGEPGDVTLQAQSIWIVDSSVIADTREDGNAGDVLIRASDRISLENTSVASSVNSEATGSGGNVNLQAGNNISLTEEAIVSADSFGFGDAGNVEVSTSFLQVDNSRIVSSLSEESGGSAGGDVDILVDVLEGKNDALLDTATFSDGNAGNLSIVASDRISLENTGVFSQSNRRESGNAGNVNIQAPQVEITADTPIAVSSATFGVGAGGDVDITADTLNISGDVEVLSASFEEGDAGDIVIRAQKVLIDKGAEVSAGTDGIGAGGNVDIQAVQIDLESSSISANTRGSGAGGNVFIQAQQLQLVEDAFISTFSFESGDAGTVSIFDADRVILQSGSRLFATARLEGAGGNIDVQTQNLQLADKSSLSTSARGSGAAGDINISGAEEIILQFRSRILADTQGTGSGGNIGIQTQKLQLQEDAVVSSINRGAGSGGTINITDAEQIDIFSRSRISADTQGSGTGGDIDIRTQQLQLQESAFIESNTLGSGSGGSVNIQAQQLQLQDLAFIRANTFDSGAGGNVNIQAQQLQLQDISFISADNSTGGGLGENGAVGPAGNIRIRSDVVRLDNSGQITAQTSSGDGGNIVVQAGDVLLLRNGSLISSTAGNAMAGGDGGNISIEAGFILAPAEENSDITANAFNGRGGNVSIAAQDVLGIAFRENLTPKSDITASSQIAGADGTVTIQTPDAETTTDSAELPVDLFDESEQVSQRLCAAGEGNTFSATGRGGLSASPYDEPTAVTEWEDWYISEPGNVAPDDSQTTSNQSATSATSETDTEVVEAQGWKRDADGTVALVAEAVSETTTGEKTASANCSQFKDYLEP